MDSSANTKQTDPRDVSPGDVSPGDVSPGDVSPGLSTQDIELVARADERLAHAYQQIVSADQQLARVNEQISRMEDDAARKKAVNKLRRPSRGRPALRGFIGLLLAAGICFAAFAAQSYGETARLMISRWAPQLASSLPPATPEPAAQQSLPVVQVVAADATTSQLSSPAQTAPQDAAPVPIPPEVTESLQTMARDLASVQQEIEQLKASQQELARENARENAKTAEQLKASQEQMARAISSASEQNQRPKRSAVTSAATSAATSANPPRRVANAARKPVSTPPPTQARARAPVQLQARQQ